MPFFFSSFSCIQNEKSKDEKKKDTDSRWRSPSSSALFSCGY